mmetsp:Transcript_57324/g.48447  ORF Transcript_57324/g.48447 Transcript_57324/m.48447 type:complete len:125 (+) Transcript_57324:219-593(+)
MLTCWGNNYFNQLVVPAQYFKAAFVSAGYYHTCAISGGQLGCWGDDEYQQLQLPKEIEQQTHTMVTTGVKQTCAINDQHHLSCWGKDVIVPKKLRKNIKYINSSENNCAVSLQGGISCWGDNFK